MESTREIIEQVFIGLESLIIAFIALKNKRNDDRD